MTAGITFRRPVESDHRFLIDQVDEWWGGRKMRQLLPRLWLRHFTSTSWILEDASGAIVGFLVGFVSPDGPEQAYIHMAATSPNHRRAGLGRALYERFLADVRARGVRRVTAVTWPGNRVSVGFHLALGFRPDDGPGTQRLYGTPAYPDYDGDGQDRVVFSLEL
jgi:ribosomal protein S18 acetylase RimI-like enzyme